jgi:hypothetical protein
MVCVRTMMLRLPSLDCTSELYETQSYVRIDTSIVRNVELTKAVRLLRYFKQRADKYNDSELNAFCRILSKYQYAYTSAPLSSQHPDIYDAQAFSYVTHLSQRFRVLYPDIAYEGIAVVSAFRALVERNDNELLDTIRGIMSRLDQELRIAVLLNATSFIKPVEHVLYSQIPSVRLAIVSPTMIRRPECFDYLFIVGPAHRFPEYVLSAPRAPDVYIVRYDAIRDAWRQRDAFLRPIRSSGSSILVSERSIDIGDDTIDESPGDTDLTVIHRYERADASTDNFENVEARPYLLAGNWMVLLETDPAASVLGIDLDNDEKLVERIPVGDVLPGMFVLLRTEGGGDYVVQMADQIMGSHASEQRRVQQHWKELLRLQVRRQGLARVTQLLTEHGAIRANEQNIRNWSSPRSIRPNDRRDFSAIMNLIGLALQDEHYWHLMGLIRQAHTLAGNQIRKKLLSQVEKVDPAELAQAAMMDFQLPGVDGGSITAFRVERAISQHFRVSASRLDRPFRVDLAGWDSSVIGTETP